jgi:hypothetical protein
MITTNINYPLSKKRAKKIEQKFLYYYFLFTKVISPIRTAIPPAKKGRVLVFWIRNDWI